MAGVRVRRGNYNGQEQVLDGHEVIFPGDSWVLLPVSGMESDGHIGPLDMFFCPPRLSKAWFDFDPWFTILLYWPFYMQGVLSRLFPSASLPPNYFLSRSCCPYSLVAHTKY